jgi:hypothetical protein
VRCSTSADGTAWPRPIACASASTRWSASSNAAGALGGERGSASVRPSLLDRHQSARCFARLNGSVAHGPYAAHRKRLRVPTRDGPSRTQRCARGITITRRTARQPAAARAAACRAADGSSTQWARTSRKVVRVGQQVRQEPIRGDRLREGAARSAHDLHRTACVCDANHGSRAAHHVRHARALARRRRRRVLPRPLELLRSGGGATEGGHTQPPADAAAVARGGPEMVRHDLACRLDGGVGLTLLVSKEAEEPANPQSHKCRGRQCASAPCVDAVLGYHGA